jgi:hypothetical protein
MQNVIPFPLQVQCRDVVKSLATSGSAETRSSIDDLVSAYDKLIALGARMALLLQLDIDAVVVSHSARTEAQVEIELAHAQAMVLRLSHQLAVLNQLREKLRAS